MSFKLSRGTGSSGYMKVQGAAGAPYAEDQVPLGLDRSAEDPALDVISIPMPPLDQPADVKWTRTASIRSEKSIASEKPVASSSKANPMSPVSPSTQTKFGKFDLALPGGIGLPPQAPDISSPLMYSPVRSHTAASEATPRVVSQSQRLQYPVGAQPEAMNGAFTGGASELFEPHGKSLEQLPAWKNMKIRSMMQAARDQCIRDTLGGDLDIEKFRRWSAVVHTAYSERSEARVDALLRLGYPPAVLRGLHDLLDSLESAIADDSEQNKGDRFSAAVTTASQLLGIKGETSELLLTTRSTDGARVMGNSVRVGADQIDAMMTGSCNKPVVTFDLLLEHLLTFSPASSADDKVELLIDMFSASDKDAEYVSMEDTQRMLAWIRKEADYSAHANQDTVDVMFQRLLRDYKRALREDSWSPDGEGEDHPDELLLADIEKRGLHRFVLAQVLLSSERGGRVHLKPGHEVIVQNVKNAELLGQKGIVIKRDPKQRGYMVVRFPDPIGEKHLKRTSLRTGPGVEKPEDPKAEQWGMYANLCLNIRPKIETDPAEIPEFGLRLLVGWIRTYFVILLFVLSVVVLGGLVFFLRFVERTEIRNMFGGSAGVSITSGMYINWLTGLAMVSGCSNVLSRIPFRFLEKYGGGTSRAYWHLALGALLFLSVIAHIVSSADVMHTMSKRNATEVNYVLDASFSPNSDGKISTTDLLKTYPFITGVVMFFLMIVVALTTLLTQHSLLFIIGHTMYIPLIGLMMAHGMEGWFEWKYQTLVFLMPFVCVVLLEMIFKWRASSMFIAEEVATVKSHRGNAAGVEFRVRRPEGGKMVQQQSGQFVEIMAPAVDGTWQPGAVVTAPEIEDETVRIQVASTRMGCEWSKTADELVVMGSESIKKLKVRGPYGLKASDALVPISSGGSGKVLLIGEFEGVHNVTAVMNDFCQSLSRPDDAVRANVSKLHRYVEEFTHFREGATPVKLEIHVIAVVKAVEGHRRFVEAMLHMLKLESEIPIELSVEVFVTQWASQGTGVECWRRMKKLGSERRHDGKRDEHHDLLLEDCLQYGYPSWDQEFLNIRYRWLGKAVDVLHWGDRDKGDSMQGACHRHSFDPSRKHLRADDQTIFNFNRGLIAQMR
eukprot:TRINITY_DN33201_c0_g1_i1.p1 TRINITY_DN33201_c0_g1~~TRINITY_DN33201_c0_g1_i1.p1  ORF type:complete len:1119 (+),score=440.77 TRINITY_DN33201_c0_g1_i1:63-3419(+)